MSGYTELRDLGVTFRPPDTPLPAAAGRSSPFEATWTRTVELFADELRHLGAERIAIELDIAEIDLRLDGLPRANATIPDPVRVSFDSKHGPLRYETGEFTSRWYRAEMAGWQANIRAIALGLEALRKVDRYGISRRGEQYRGWRALPTGTDPADAIQTEEQAWAQLTRAAGVPVDSSLLLNGLDTREIVRRALRATHPDRGGDQTEFRKVMRAKEILGV